MTRSEPDRPDRRRLLGAAAAVGAVASLGEATLARPFEEARRVKITCFIRYQIDPTQRNAFAAYAKAWGHIIPRCGGQLVGYFLPWEGTNDVAWGLITFDSLAVYEGYRSRLKADPEARRNFEAAASQKFILREERTFTEAVEGAYALGTAA